MVIWQKKAGHAAYLGGLIVAFLSGPQIYGYFILWSLNRKKYCKYPRGYNASVPQNLQSAVLYVMKRSSAADAGAGLMGKYRAAGSSM